MNIICYFHNLYLYIYIYIYTVILLQIIQLKDSLSVTQTQALRHKSALIDEKIELQQKKLREGGMDAWKGKVGIMIICLVLVKY